MEEIMWQIMIKVETSDFWTIKPQYEWRPMQTSCGVVYTYKSEESARKTMMDYYGMAYYEGRAKVEKIN